MATAFKQVANNAQSTLASGITAGATSMSVAVGHGGRFPAPGNGFYVTIWDASLYPDPRQDAAMEIVLVTARSGDNLTVTRGQNGTSAAAHAAGQAVKLLLDASHITDLQTAVNTLESNSGNVSSANGNKIQAGSGSTGWYNYGNGSVSFASAYNSPPIVILTPNYTATTSNSTYTSGWTLYLHSSNTTGFNVRAKIDGSSGDNGGVSATFTWVAIGT